MANLTELIGGVTAAIVEGDTTTNIQMNIQVVTALPAITEPNTLYLIRA